MSSTQKTSLASLVSVAAGLLVVASVNLHWPALVTMLLSTLAVFSGHFARAAIRSDPGQLDGNAMAITGLAIGYIGLVAGTVAFLLIHMALMSFGGK
ncbi:MAG: DUF4190 domain-containing protein [Pseudomonadota bacterium]|nr:DUF4190 domain-containing protein [Pseudomonadota bacterium]